MNSIYQEISKLSPEERRLFELLFKKEGLQLEQLPILDRGRGDFPLSLSQERVWVANQFSLEASCDNVPVGFRVRGKLECPVLERALNRVSARHEILRVRCQVRDGEVFQRVDADYRFTLPVEDLSGISEELRWGAAMGEARLEARRKFELSGGSLLRGRIWRLADDDWLILFLTHQLLLDGWSIQIFLRELSEFYAEELEGRQATLLELPVQYGDFAAWQREVFRAEVLESQAEYWRKQLKGAPAMQVLPVDRARPQIPSARGAMERVVFPAEVSEGLRALSRGEGTTVFMTMMALFQTLLHRYSGETDVIVGTAISNRNRIETENLIGNFANNLLLRMDFSGDPTFRQVLRRVGSTVTDAFAHQDLPLEQLMQSASGEQERGTIPKVQTLLILRDREMVECLELGAARIEPVLVETGFSRLDLTLDLSESPEGFNGYLTYKTDLFERATIEGISKYLLCLAESVLRAPEVKIAALPGPPSKMKADAIGLSEGKPERVNVPPRDSVERKLAEIWQSVLGISPVSVRDSFFELGGHSLVAVSLFTEIEKAFGKKLPLAVLFRAPTIEQMAGELRRNESAASWSCLVPIRSEGSDAPLFLIHAIGGNLLNYSELVQRLDKRWPVYGLQSRGLDGKSEPLVSVEEMAGLYIREIRQVWPSGPFHLAGTSFGGVVAYEMARQLAAMGLAVGSLVLMDSYHLHYEKTGRNRFFAMLESYASRARFHLENLLFRANRLEYIHSRLNVAGGRLRRVIRNRAWELARSYFQLSGRPLPPALHRVNDANHYAFRCYQPKPYEGDLVLFRSSELSVAHSHSPEAAWRGLVKGEMVVYDVPGNHVTTMFEPHVRVVAEKLEQYLMRRGP